MSFNAAHWQSRLDDLIEKYKVPGATLAILQDGEVLTAASGFVNLDTGVEATTDSVFQIGSITKVYTATLIMQLVDEGLVSLDEPIITYLPGFQVGDAEITKTVTLRHLLSHTSGIDGDVFIDLGRGDDVIERYLEELRELPQNHPIGATHSYCNSGFVISGRILEVLLGRIWDAVLQDKLSKPLGLTSTVTLAEEAIRFRAATGHVDLPDGSRILSPVWSLPRPMGPAGLITSTAADVVAFAKLHIDKGIAADRTRLLSEESVALMQQPVVAIPDPHVLGSHWGIGWILFDWPGGDVIGHDGNTLGQSGFLRMAPELGLAVSLLVNGGDSRGIYLELYREIFAAYSDIVVPSAVVPSHTPVDIDLSRFVGVYERYGTRAEVEISEGKLVLTVKGTGAMTIDQPPVVITLEQGDDEGQFLGKLALAANWTSVKFYSLPDGTPHLYFGVRSTPKVS